MIIVYTTFIDRFSLTVYLKFRSLFYLILFDGGCTVNNENNLRYWHSAYQRYCLYVLWWQKNLLRRLLKFSNLNKTLFNAENQRSISHLHLHLKRRFETWDIGYWSYSYNVKKKLSGSISERLNLKYTILMCTVKFWNEKKLTQPCWR